MPNDNVYFAADESKKTVSHLQQKGQQWFDSLSDTNYFDIIKRSWDAYHGRYYDSSHSINYGGEVGELVNISVNHYRNIASHMLTMTTAARPAFQARARNTDYKSQVQTLLANGLLEYYMKEKRIEKVLKKAVEYAVVFGSGFIRMDWDATTGEIYDYIRAEPEFEVDVTLEVDQNGEYIIEEDGSYLTVEGEFVLPLTNEDGDLVNSSGRVLEDFAIYEGDVRLTNLSPYDVLFDSTKEDYDDNDWVVVRTFKNKYDLAKKFPEMRDKILGVKTKDEILKHRIYMSKIDETVDVPVYEFFHKKTESMENGRYLMYLDDDVVLMDTPLPYSGLPIYRISPSDILGTAYGYTSMFDLLPLQEATNSLYSIVTTNQSAFGVQSILNPRGNDVNVTQLSSGMNYIEYNPVVAGGHSGEPKSMQLTNTPQEIFTFIQMIEQAMETISGINSVVRGNPESSLKSGNALALVQAQALQFISGLQQSYIMLIEDIGTGLIKLLQTFASVPRVAEISGINNRSEMKMFKADDIDQISRVSVDVGNALASTTAGKIQMADNLIQMGLIKTAEQYFSVINTGRLDTMTEGAMDHNLLIRRENELLVDNSKPVVAIPIDAHSQHIREHMNVLADPDLRTDASLVKRVLDHIMEHVTQSRTTDPALLAMIGEQSLGPVAGSPPAPGTVAPIQPSDQSLGGIEGITSNPAASSVLATEGTAPAQPATLPGQPNTAAEQFRGQL